MSAYEGTYARENPAIKAGESLTKSRLEILKDERESILNEVLRCCVCLELPVGKQVRICEEGHHFCGTCHNKIEFCGICRGKLLGTRNFVVEQLVVKMGTMFGFTEQELPPAKPPVKFTKGVYPCTYECTFKGAAFKMLAHMRRQHKDNLVERVRSNPYSDRFSCVLNIRLTRCYKYIWSVQVCDMGLFTVELGFNSFDFFGCVKMLYDNDPPFKYQLVMKIPNKRAGSVSEYGVTDCPMSSFLDDTESIKAQGRGLDLMNTNLLQLLRIGDSIDIFFSVWGSTKKLKIDNHFTPSVFCIPEKNLYFFNDRKFRRNKNRNLRRKRLKENLRGDDFYLGSDTLSVTDVFGVLVL